MGEQPALWIFRSRHFLIKAWPSKTYLMTPETTSIGKAVNGKVHTVIILHSIHSRTPRINRNSELKSLPLDPHPKFNRRLKRLLIPLLSHKLDPPKQSPPPNVTHMLLFSQFPLNYRSSTMPIALHLSASPSS